MMFRVLAALSMISLTTLAHATTVRCTLSISSDAKLDAQQGFASLAPGSTVCIAPGTYRRQLTIAGVKGTASAQITFLVQPVTGSANFTAGVLLRETSHVTVSGFDVTLDPRLGPGSAVTLDVGSSDNTVRGLTVHDAYVAVSIGSSAGPAGAGNKVVDNVVRDNWNTGIAVGELSDGTPQDYNVIEHNRVLASGGHGIEINDSNYIVVRGNFVSTSGTGLRSVRQGGYSGIHLFASERTNDASTHGVRTAHNVISGNTVEGTRERATNLECDDGSGAGVCTDGNGIQVDQYCSQNEVLSNTVTGNAGDGISVYGAANNLIKDNYVRGNNQQAGRRRFFPGPAEIAVSAVNLAFGSTIGNTVTGNTAITTVNKIPAFYLSANAGRNQIGADNRWLQETESRPDSSWGPVYVGTTWHSAGTALRAFADLAG